MGAAAGTLGLELHELYASTESDFEAVFAAIEASLPGLHDWVDERLGQDGQR